MGRDIDTGIILSDKVKKSIKSRQSSLNMVCVRDHCIFDQTSTLSYCSAIF